MSKQKALKLVNLGLALTFICVAISAILKMADLIPEKIYGFIHVLPGLAMIVFAIIHINLNRNWINGAYFKKEDK